MPLSDHSRAVTRTVHQFGEGRPSRVEIAPIAFRFLPDHSGGPDEVGIATGHQGGPGGGADRTIGVELVETQARVHQVVNRWSTNVLASEGRKIAVAQVINEDAEDIRLLGEE